jgi:hypothetical protein
MSQDVEYTRFLAAEAALDRAGIDPERILDALTGMVELLGSAVLADQPPERLRTDAVALVALPRDWRARTGVAAATSAGLVVRLAEAPPADGRRLARPRWEVEGQSRLRDFDACRDRIVGLYWTRHAHVFRRSNDVVVTVRRGAEHHAYLCPFDDPSPVAPVEGSEVPPWMRVCPVAAPLGVDLLHDGVDLAPPERTTAAARLHRTWVLTHATPPDDGAVSDGGLQTEGEAIACLEQGVVIASRNQTLKYRELGYAGRTKQTSYGEGWAALGDPLWTWTLPHQPISLCPLPTSEGRSRLLVGCEAGYLALGVVVGRAAIARVWDGLRERLERTAGLQTTRAWTAWAARVLDEARAGDVRTWQRRAVTVLHLVLEHALAVLPRDPGEIDAVALLFRRTLTASQFRPILRIVRERIHAWETDATHPGARILWEIYGHLSHEIQDLFDLAVRPLDRAPAAVSGQTPDAGAPATDDDEAFGEFLRNCRVSRRKLLQNGARPLTRAVIHGEAWLSSYVLELAEGSENGRRGVLRAVPGQPWILLAHREGLIRLRVDRDSPVEKLSMPGWSRPARGVLVVPSAAGGVATLACASEQMIALYPLGVAQQTTAYWALEAGFRLVTMAVAGPDRLLIAAAAEPDHAGEIWLWSLSERAVIARMPWEEAMPRDLVVVAGAGAELTVAIGGPEDSVSVLLLAWSAETGELRVERRLQRRLFGRVRSLAVLPAGADGEASLLVGTTEGYVCRLEAGGPAPSLRLAWLYRVTGAVRHLAVRAGGGEIAALTARGEIAVLDARGCRIWWRRLQESVRSGAFVEVPGEGGVETFLAIVDARGDVRVYRRTDRALERERACGAALSIADPIEPERSPAREMVWAMRQLHAGAAPSLAGLRSHEARVSVLRWLIDELEAGAPSDAVLGQLLAVVREEALSLRELAAIARARALPASRDARRRLVTVLREEIVLRSDVRDRPRVDLLAELVSGIGADLVTPRALLREALPSAARSDAWVLVSLLLLAAGETGDRSFASLVDRAFDLTPAALTCLPALVALEDAPLAEDLAAGVAALTEASEGRALREPRWTGPPGTHVLTDILFMVLESERRWRDLVGACKLAPLTPEEARRLHPVMRHLRALVELYQASTGAYQLPLDRQRELLDELRAAAPPRPPAGTGELQAWLEKLGERWVQVVREIIDTHRRALHHVTRVRLERLRVLHLADDVVSIRADLVCEGRDAGGARARLAVDPMGSQIRALDVPLALDVALDRLPAELSFHAAIDRGTAEIAIDAATTTSSGQVHQDRWTIAVPAPPRAPSARLLEKLPDTQLAVLQALAPLNAGVHVVAINDELGPAAIVRALVARGGFRPVSLDEEMADRGPGRRDPEGLSAAGILACLGAVDADGPRPRIPERVIVHPATETTRRLLGAGLRHVLRELAGRLERTSGRAILWVVPAGLAGQLEAALGGETRYHPVHRAARVSREIVEWLGVGEELAAEAVRKLGGDLRLLHAWASEPPATRSSPEAFLASFKRAKEMLADDLAGLGIREHADLLVAARGRVSLPVRALAAGMIAADARTDGARIAAGEPLRKQHIHALKADSRQRGAFVVSGHRPGTSENQIPSELEPLALALARGVDQQRHAHRRLADRGAVEVIGGVAAPTWPYVAWIRAALEEDVSGRRFVEGGAGGKLLDALSLADLAGAGDGLSRLCPELGKPALTLVRGIGGLYRAGKAEIDQIESVCRSLTGCKGRRVEATGGDPGGELLGELRSVLGDLSLVHVERHGDHDHYLGYLPTRPASTLRVSEVAAGRGRNVVTLFGPGLEAVQIHESSALCVLTEALIKEIVLVPDPPTHFWRVVRNRVGLLPFSPFQAGNQLPEDSPVFVGREEEIERVLSGLGRHSFLIVGGRQIGKTSLLRHLYGRVKADPQRTPIWVDAAGIRRGADLLPKLRLALGEPAISEPPEPDAMISLERLLRRLPVCPIVFINEADGLCADDPEFLWRLRALTEGDRAACQFVFCGYQRAYNSTRQVGHPFFHFTQGKTGDKAFILGALQPHAAEQLIAKLEAEPLGLRWASREIKERGYRLLLERSHCIPILLQHHCQALVEWLHRERRTVIAREDVEAAFPGQGSPAWDYIQSTRPGLPGANGQRTQSWIDLVLGVIVLNRYPDPATLGRDGARVPSTSIDFSALAARREVRACASRPFTREECERLDEAFRAEAYEELLEALTLTVLVAPVPGGDRAYHFPGHIYPIELHAFLSRTGTTIEDYLLKKLADISELL